MAVGLGIIKRKYLKQKFIFKCVFVFFSFFRCHKSISREWSFITSVANLNEISVTLKGKR